jgi:hypothetical protein
VLFDGILKINYDKKNKLKTKNLYSIRNKKMSSIFYMLNNFFSNPSNTVTQDDEKSDDYDFADDSEQDDNSESEDNEDVVLHKEDGPALCTDGGNEQEWWYNGKRHKIGGPAVIRKGLRKNKLRDITYEEKEWWQNGELHREDGPARTIKHPFGIYTREEWWFNGKLHRERLPAVVERRTDYLETSIYENNTVKVLLEEWWLDGRRHNPSGPSVQETMSSVRSEWWDNGEKDITRGSYNSYKKVRADHNLQVNNNLQDIINDKLF